MQINRMTKQSVGLIATENAHFHTPVKMLHALLAIKLEFIKMGMLAPM